jgi:hypothetical protein
LSIAAMYCRPARIECLAGCFWSWLLNLCSQLYKEKYVLNKPTAVIRREIIANTGSDIYGIKRNDRVRSPRGEVFIFLGVGEGIAYVERVDKTKGKPFVEVDSSEFSRWHKM